MDIDLLSKMVKELILDNDKVTLPGLGSFVAEIVPASFSDKGFTINPPYRRLYFRSRPDQGSLLAEFYASMNNVDNDLAEKIVKDYVAELKALLYLKKAIVLPGLGRLRATKENNVFFVADEDLDIYPDGFGLEPVSLKTHSESKEEVSAMVAGLKTILQEKEEPVQSELVNQVEVLPAEPEETVPSESVETVHAELEEVEPVEVEETVEVEEADEVVEVEVSVEAETEVVTAEETEVSDVVEQRAERGFWKVLLRVVLVVVLSLIVLLIVYIVFSHLCPGVIDKMLYSPEELEILNYNL